MAHAYTPGLRVAKRTVVWKERTLPLKGKVLVAAGAEVRSDQVVAETHLPGDVHIVNVVNQLGVTPDELRDHMLKKEGDPVKKGEPIALAKGFFGLFRTTVPSPIDGSVETISSVTGQVLLRTPPRPVQVRAFVDGRVVEVRADEGCTIECAASFIQGIFGVGGETWGPLVVAVGSKQDVLSPDKIKDEHRGKVVVGGSLVPYEAIERARKVGVAGIVGGGLRDEDLRRLLGYDLGVAITGQEAIGITVVVTEGFGKIDMADRTFNLLRARAGAKASISGATQIRAGVIRPEVIVPYEGAAAVPGARTIETAAIEKTGMRPGDPIRIIRSPGFGRLGKVKSLPPELRRVESETKVRVLEVELEDGAVATLPRANVEAIEEQ